MSSPSIAHRLARFLCKVFCYLYLSLKVVGVEHIPRRGGFILAANHVSYIDPVACGVASPRLLNYMARASLFSIPVFGAMIRLFGAFPLKRSSVDISAIKEALRRLGRGEGLILFPQGTRSSDGSIDKGLLGVGFLARKSGVPVIPTYVKGTHEALPRGARLIKPAKIQVIFGRPVSFSNHTDTSDRDFTDMVMGDISRLRTSFDT